MKQDTNTGKTNSENYCYFYLHANGDLIHKHKHYDPSGFEESDFVRKWWAIDLDNRIDAYNMLISASIHGAKKDRVNELVREWEINDLDCSTYCDRVGLTAKMDGNAWCVHGNGFTDMQESVCGFGDTMFRATVDFYEKKVNG